MGKPRTQKGRATETAKRLADQYPDAKCALDFSNPFQLLAATILSAQCTDERVNMVTPELFAKYPDPEAMAGANPEELEEIIRSTGFFRNKAKSLIGMASGVARDYGGEVPNRMEDLVKLPGVGRKTANVLLSVAFRDVELAGIAVDTHVARLSRRLGLTEAKDPNAIEQDLMGLLPRKEWGDISLRLIMHGRAVCDARRPKCGECCLADFCPSAEFT
ncbi:MAG: endonuclease III [Acidobacteria bacterium]|nr:MAG: endonuclease III [Acidobacteriota bacterium]